MANFDATLKSLPLSITFRESVLQIQGSLSGKVSYQEGLLHACRSSGHCHLAFGTMGPSILGRTYE